MRLLIDGYNLLHASGVMGRAIGPGALERARDRLIAQLTLRIEETLRAQTVIVFDSRSAPPGAAREMVVNGLQIRFAVDYVSADEMLVELVRSHNAPEILLVVSSDHQVQVASSRRGAKVVDSDRWWERNPVLADKAETSGNAIASPPKPPAQPQSSTSPDAQIEHKKSGRAIVPTHTLAQADTRSAPDSLSKIGNASAAKPSAAEARRLEQQRMAQQLEQAMSSTKPPQSKGAAREQSQRHAAPSNDLAKPASPSQPTKTSADKLSSVHSPESETHANRTEASSASVVGSDEVNFWLQQFAEPKPESPEKRRVTQSPRSSTAPTASSTASSARDGQATTSTSSNPTPADPSTTNESSTRSGSGKHKGAAKEEKRGLRGGSDFDFPDDYLQQIQAEIEREQE